MAGDIRVDVQVGVYRAADRTGVTALWRAVFPITSPRHEPEVSLRLKLAAQPELLLVARCGDRVVGTVMAGYDGHRGWLYSVAVDAAHRRQGVGTKLVRHAEAALAGLGCVKINLQVMPENREVLAFYERLGYAVEERVSMGKAMDSTRR